MVSANIVDSESVTEGGNSDDHEEEDDLPGFYAHEFPLGDLCSTNRTLFYSPFQT
jgi:hypothetical protein